MKTTMAIVGHGFVGKAVDYGFRHKDLTKIIIDPKQGTSVSDLKDKEVHIAFVCVPTPMMDDGSINSSIVKDVVAELLEYGVELVVIKSTITPDVIEALQEDRPEVVYNPEFLTERNYAEDFINPPFHIFGVVEKGWAHALHDFYKNYSKCKECPVHIMTGVEASFTKYGINSFLASKVLWFNQFYDAVASRGANYNVILKALTSDPRITESHTQVPGFDGKKGFSGACFPKDSLAFYKFDPEHLTLLKDVINKNNAYRSQYEVDEREREQNIKFDFFLD